MIITPEFKYEEQVSGRPSGRNHKEARESGHLSRGFRWRLKNISECGEKQAAVGRGL